MFSNRQGVKSIMVYWWWNIMQSLKIQYKFSLRKKVKVEVTQSCLTLCNPMDYTVHGILQARILEWVAIPFSRGSSQPRD